VINGSRIGEGASVRVVSRRTQIENDSLFSVRQAAAACNVSPPVVRRWLSLGLLSAPPWTFEQLQSVRDRTDPQRHRHGTHAAHGTMARWNAGCSCARCRQLQSTRPGSAGDRERKPGCPSRHDSSSSMRSTAGNHSGSRFVILV
jgi:hypothetical protein